MKTENKQYALARGVTFPAGTPVFVMRAGSSTEYCTPHASALIDNGPDSFADMRIDLDEAIDGGMVVEVGE